MGWGSDELGEKSIFFNPWKRLRGGVNLNIILRISCRSISRLCNRIRRCKRCYCAKNKSATIFICSLGQKSTTLVISWCNKKTMFTRKNTCRPLQKYCSTHLNDKNSQFAILCFHNLGGEGEYLTLQDNAYPSKKNSIWFSPGWQNLAAFRREQKWQWKFLSNAYLQFSHKMRRFCA